MNNPQRSDSPVVSCFASVLLQGLLTPIEMYWAQPREPLYPGGLDFAICFPTVRHLPSQDSLFLEPVMFNGDSLNRGTSFTMSFSCPSSCDQRKGHWPSRSQLSTCSVLITSSLHSEQGETAAPQSHFPLPCVCFCMGWNMLGETLVFTLNHFHTEF